MSSPRYKWLSYKENPWIFLYINSINVSLKYINEGLYFNERLLKERKMENKSRKCEKKKKETCFKGKKLINAGL